MSIIQKLRGLSKSSEYEAAIPDLEAGLEAAEALLPDLRTAHEQAIFDGTDREVKATEEAIKDHVAKIDTLRIALKGAERRKQEALNRERRDELEVTMQAAQAAASELENEYRRFAKAARSVCDARKAILDLRARISGANNVAGSQGATELMVKDPLSVGAKRYNETKAGPALSGYDPCANGFNIPSFWHPGMPNPYPKTPIELV